ncbi:MAG: acyl-CoA dehydrogenase family protein, partial [Ilumatobacteraceae bacterium]
MTTTAPDIQTAASVISTASAMVDTAIASLIALGGPDKNQTLAYDIAHVAAAVATAKSLLPYGAKGTTEGNITCAFTADMVHDFVSRLIGRDQLWGVDPSLLSSAHDFVQTYRAPSFIASLAEVQGPRHLASDFEMVQDTFRSYANKVIAPQAEHVHRHNGDVPEEIIAGLAEIGAFGLSVPVEYEGFSEGGEGEYMASVIATEELSRASLGIGGSLITRPEILTRALVKGGTEAQKHEWLPKLASTEVMSAVAVTEPDYGSDVASLKTTAV